MENYNAYGQMQNYEFQNNQYNANEYSPVNTVPKTQIILAIAILVLLVLGFLYMTGAFKSVKKDTENKNPSTPVKSETPTSNSGTGTGTGTTNSGTGTGTGTTNSGTGTGTGTTNSGTGTTNTTSGTGTNINAVSVVYNASIPTHDFFYIVPAEDMNKVMNWSGSSTKWLNMADLSGDNLNQKFKIVPFADGTVRIICEGDINKRFMHWNGNGDRGMSIGDNHTDDFTKFFMETDSNGYVRFKCYKYNENNPSYLTWVDSKINNWNSMQGIPIGDLFMTPNHSKFLLVNSKFTIKNTPIIANNGNAIDISSDSKIVHSTYRGNETQKWNYDNRKLINRDKCLSVQGFSLVDGTDIVYDTCTDNSSQKWVYAKSGQFINFNKKCLEIKDGRLIQNSCSDSKNQIWKI